MIKTRNQVGAEFFKKWVMLEGKKDKLHAMGYSPEWKLDLNKHKINREAVVSNKDLSRFLMLPNVSYKHNLIFKGDKFS